MILYSISTSLIPAYLICYTRSNLYFASSFKTIFSDPDFYRSHIPCSKSHVQFPLPTTCLSYQRIHPHLRPIVTLRHVLSFKVTAPTAYSLGLYSQVPYISGARDR